MFDFLITNTTRWKIIIGVLCLAGFRGTTSLEAAETLDSARVREISRFIVPKPNFGRPIADRAAWEKLAQAPGFASVISDAEALATKPVPEATDDGFLDYSRTGNRDRYQAVLFARSSRLLTLTLAECFENKGRFLKPLEETVKAICTERTWVYPAHDGSLNNFYGRSVDPDLRATAVGWDLATANALLGEKFSPATRPMIRENVQRRVLQPFLDMAHGKRKEIHWLKARHNWNAVCIANTLGAALASVESPEDRAIFATAAEHYIRNFLSGFTPDGYCSEGVGYWNYGFGHFIMLTELLRDATGEKMDLFTDPLTTAPALYATRTEILNDIYPSVADCSPGSRPNPQLLRYVRERFDVGSKRGQPPTFQDLGRSLGETVLFAFMKTPLPKVIHEKIKNDSPLRTWFDSGGLLICRTASGATQPFATALKGGHNAEFHNHNDVGSFSVVVGKTMLICDPGAEVYTARTFGSHRYDSKVLNSYGHAVPAVAGKLQSSGAGAKAIVRETNFADESDTIRFDLRSAYAVPELKKLERTFVFRRASEKSLLVRDEISFSEPKSFESALITWDDWKTISADELLISRGSDAVRVKIDTGGKPFQVSAETLNEDVRTPKKPVRIGIVLVSPITNATVSLTISPAKPAVDR